MKTGVIRNIRIYEILRYIICGDIRDVGTQNIVIKKTRDTLCVETQDMGRYEKQGDTRFGTKYDDMRNVVRDEMLSYTRYGVNRGVVR